MSKVLVVEDEAIFRSLIGDHLKSAFNVSKVIEAGDGHEGWDQFRKHEPDFCIVDLRLPKLRGEMLVNLMQCHDKPPRILVLSGQTSVDLPEWIHNTEQLFFVEKMAPLAKLNEVLKCLFDREQTNPGDFGVKTRKTEKVNSLDHLTLREKTILAMVGEGKKSEAIGNILGISVHTVRTHRRNLMQKLGMHSTALLVRYAVDSGLTEKNP